MAKPKPVRSPITWLGGKGVVKTKILPLLPPHDYYVEPFGGGASILPLGAPEIGTQMSQQRQSKPSSTAPSTASSGSRPPGRTTGATPLSILPACVLPD